MEGNGAPCLRVVVQTSCIVQHTLRAGCRRTEEGVPGSGARRWRRSACFLETRGGRRKGSGRREASGTAGARAGGEVGQSETYLGREEVAYHRKWSRASVSLTCLASTSAVHSPTYRWLYSRRRCAMDRCNLLDYSRTERMPDVARRRRKANHTQGGRLPGRRGYISQRTERGGGKE